MTWVIHILNGVAFGMLLFLLAAGLSLIYGLMKILNLTHGSFYLVGGYIGLTVVQLTGSFLLALVAAVLAIALLGAVIERFFLRQFHLDELPQTLVTFGFLFIFSDLSLWIWGGNPLMLNVPQLFPGLDADGLLRLSVLPAVSDRGRACCRRRVVVVSGTHPARHHAARGRR